MFKTPLKTPGKIRELGYRDLQAIAKDVGIKANQKSCKLVEALEGLVVKGVVVEGLSDDLNLELASPMEIIESPIVGNATDAKVVTPTMGIKMHSCISPTDDISPTSSSHGKSRRKSVAVAASSKKRKSVAPPSSRRKSVAVSRRARRASTVTTTTEPTAEVLDMVTTSTSANHNNDSSRRKSTRRGSNGSGGTPPIHPNKAAMRTSSGGSARRRSSIKSPLNASSDSLDSLDSAVLGEAMAVADLLHQAAVDAKQQCARSSEVDAFTKLQKFSAVDLIDVAHGCSSGGARMSLGMGMTPAGMTPTPTPTTTFVSPTKAHHTLKFAPLPPTNNDAPDTYNGGGSSKQARRLTTIMTDPTGSRLSTGSTSSMESRRSPRFETSMKSNTNNKTPPVRPSRKSITHTTRTAAPTIESWSSMRIVTPPKARRQSNKTPIKANTPKGFSFAAPSTSTTLPQSTSNPVTFTGIGAGAGASATKKASGAAVTKRAACAGAMSVRGGGVSKGRGIKKSVVPRPGFVARARLQQQQQKQRLTIEQAMEQRRQQSLASNTTDTTLTTGKENNSIEASGATMSFAAFAASKSPSKIKTTSFNETTHTRAPPIPMASANGNQKSAARPFKPGSSFGSLSSSTTRGRARQAMGHSAAKRNVDLMARRGIHG